MSKNEILKYHNDITALLRCAKLYDAFALFNELLDKAPNWEISEELMKLQTSYKYMLSYMVQGINDPQKEHIYANLLSSFYSLVDKYCHAALSKVSRSQYFAIAQDFANVKASLTSVLGEFSAAYEKYKLYIDLPERDNNTVIELTRNVEKAETRLFNYIWTTFLPSADECDKLKKVMTAESTPYELKQLLLSAIMLNVNNAYNELLLLILLDLYEPYRANENLAMRLLCCIFMILHKYHYVAALSPAVNSRIDMLKDDDTFKSAINIIALQFIKSCDTEKLTKLVHDELIPSIMNAGNGFFKNLKGAKIDPNDLSEMESNPEWENFLEKSGFADKIKEISEIQMDGGDIFMGTFANLKSFPFFYDIANWFMPFYAEHSVVASSPIAGNKLIMSVITNAVLCDSDRYSFCLSINSLSDSQRDAMLAQFDSQNQMLDELKNAEIDDTKINRKQTVANYMQGLYRFFKLYNRRNEFTNPFSGNILDNAMLADIICTAENLSVIGEYYLKNKYFDLALTYFKKEFEIHNDCPPSILQKIGFCYQNLKMYDEAVKYYLKYDLFDNSSAWNIKHIAASYKAMGNIEKALEYYTKVETLFPDNISVSLNIGHCLLEMNKIPEALKYYFKVDYLAPESNKALRPIAWCLFLQKNFTQSREYYAKIMNASPTAEDYMNQGHLLLACGNIKEAIVSYGECLKMMDENFTKFADSFNDDRKYLEATGVSIHDTALVMDIIHYNL